MNQAKFLQPPQLTIYYNYIIMQHVNSIPILNAFCYN